MKKGTKANNNLISLHPSVFLSLFLNSLKRDIYIDFESFDRPIRKTAMFVLNLLNNVSAMIVI